MTIIFHLRRAALAIKGRHTCTHTQIHHCGQKRRSSGHRCSADCRRCSSAAAGCTAAPACRCSTRRPHNGTCDTAPLKDDIVSRDLQVIISFVCPFASKSRTKCQVVSQFMVLQFFSPFLQTNNLFRFTCSLKWRMTIEKTRH